MAKYKIEIECDEWWVADSLYTLSAMVESNNLLDGVENDGKVQVSFAHFTATIKENK